MGQKSTQQTEIPNAGPREEQLSQLLAMLAKKAGGSIDFNSLAQLASGGVGGPTEQDVNLVNQSIGATGDIARRQLERDLGPIIAQIAEGNTARGVQGSSFEGLNKLLGTRELQGRYADVLSQAQGQGAQALMNLPFQRADAKLGANQALFNMLSGSANPVLANALQARMAQPKTTTKTPADWGQIMKSAAAIGAIPFTGGASALALPAAAGGGMSYNTPDASGYYGRGHYSPYIQ